MDRRCAWCPRPIPPGTRRDAIYCGKPCRQAVHRFRRAGRPARHVARGRARQVASRDATLRLAYADPPYPGLAKRYYAGHPDFAGEVDHEQLVARLEADFPGGWALSTSAMALRDVLAMCPPDTRVAAWFRGERPTRSYRPLVAWEPVIYVGGRPYLSDVDTRRIDALVHTARARSTDPGRGIGAKPAAFCYWLFNLLGALPGDELVDLYPGSGGVARAWRDFSASVAADPRDVSRLAAAQDDTSRRTCATRHVEERDR